MQQYFMSELCPRILERQTYINASCYILLRNTNYTTYLVIAKKKEKSSKSLVFIIEDSKCLNRPAAYCLPTATALVWGHKVILLDSLLAELSHWSDSN